VGSGTPPQLGPVQIVGLSCPMKSCSKPLFIGDPAEQVGAELGALQPMRMSSDNRS